MLCAGFYCNKLGDLDLKVMSVIMTKGENILS